MTSTTLPPLPPIPQTKQPAEKQEKTSVNISRATKPRIIKLSCAACGASLDVEAGLTNIECRYCGTPQAVVGRRGIRRMMVLDRHTREEAESVLRSWLSHGIRKEGALKKEAHIEESFLAFFPFVHCRFDIVGWILGFDERRKKRGNREVKVRVPVEKRVERRIDRSLAAAHMSEFGVGRVNLAGDEILPLDEETLKKRGMVFRPNRSPEESAMELEAEALRETRSEAEPEHTSFAWLSALRRRRHLVYYPLWVFRYSFRGRNYQALIDAEDAHLAYGKAPGSSLWRAFAVVSSCAGAAFIGTSTLQHLGSLFRSEHSLGGLVLLGLMLFSFVKWGYSQFREGGVVEEGDGIIRKKHGIRRQFHDNTELLQRLGGR